MNRLFPILVESTGLTFVFQNLVLVRVRTLLKLFNFLNSNMKAFKK